MISLCFSLIVMAVGLLYWDFIKCFGFWIWHRVNFLFIKKNVSFPTLSLWLFISCCSWYFNCLHKGCCPRTPQMWQENLDITVAIKLISIWRNSCEQTPNGVSQECWFCVWNVLPVMLCYPLDICKKKKKMFSLEVKTSVDIAIYFGTFLSVSKQIKY